MQTTLPDTPTLRPYFLSMIFLFWGLFYRGGNGYHFQGSRGGNDTRLHCLGTVEYLGLFFYCFVTFFVYFFLIFLWIVSLYIGLGW